MIENVLAWFKESKDNNVIYIYHNDEENKDVYMVALRDDGGTLIGYYEKHEYRNSRILLAEEIRFILSFFHPLPADKSINIIKKKCNKAKYN